ncbi:MAG TPA: riboflavin biosynthesis protein RibF [Tepidisphaeraceae bacterium]|nr:riboflavin biosynthesis protein RibF [Tepidisphaeraceae bacterium]
MNVHEGIEGLEQLPAGAVISIGNFDGLHLGHARILQTMMSLQHAMPGAHRALVTFEPHPLTILRPELAPPRLTPYPLKRRLLELAGVEHLVILPPSREVLGLTAEKFWEILRDRVRPSHIVEGSRFNFGKGRSGTIERLREWTSQSQVKLHVVEKVQVPLLNLHIVEVSSSLVRWLIAYGRVRDAAICLGRPYGLQGLVVRGFGRGREIDVPTANLDCKDQLIPTDGVYAGRCKLGGKVHPAAISIGTMPTFGEHQRQIEAHLLGFSGDLYDQVIEVELTDWIRDQVRFDGVQQLRDQLAVDFLDVRSRAKVDVIRPIAELAVT